MIHSQNTVSKLMASPVSRTAGNTISGWIDARYSDRVTIECDVSSIAGPGVASASGGSIVVLESDDTHVSNATAIAGASASGMKIEQKRIFDINTKAKKRIIHATFTAGTPGVSNEAQTVSITGRASKLEVTPTAAAGMVTGFTNSGVVIVN